MFRAGLIVADKTNVNVEEDVEVEVEEAEGRRQERAATKEAGKAGEAAAVFGWLLEKERLQGLLVEIGRAHV